MHEVLVNRLGGLSLPRKSVVRLTDRPDMTLDVYRGRKTTMQQQQHSQPALHTKWESKTIKGHTKQNKTSERPNDQLFVSRFPRSNPIKRTKVKTIRKSTTNDKSYSKPQQNHHKKKGPVMNNRGWWRG